MKAVIMAGGMGTRLNNYLKDIPKPLVMIGEKPILQYQIENLKRYGVNEVILIIGYLGRKIKEYFSNGGSFGVSITYFEEEYPLGTAGALYYIKDKLKSDFLLLYGDIILDIDFNRFIAFHKSKDAIASLIVHSNNHPNDSDILEVDNQSIVRRILKKNVKRPLFYNNCVNAGVYILNLEFLGFIAENIKQDLEKDIIEAVIPSGRIYAYKTIEYIKDMGTPERYNLVAEHLRTGIVSVKNLSNKQKAIFLDRDGTINKYIGLLSRPEEIEIYDQVFEAIRLINNSEYICIVITNQPVIARNICSIDQLEDIHRKLEMDLGEKGVFVDEIYYCPHHPDGGYSEENKQYKTICSCRKPKIGLIEKAARDYNIDLTHSYVIGDTTVDIQTGVNAGLKTILLSTGEGGKDNKYFVSPDFYADNLLDAVKIVLGG